MQDTQLQKGEEDPEVCAECPSLVNAVEERRECHKFHLSTKKEQNSLVATFESRTRKISSLFECGAVQRRVRAIRKKCI